MSRVWMAGGWWGQRGTCRNLIAWPSRAGAPASRWAGLGHPGHNLALMKYHCLWFMGVWHFSAIIKNILFSLNVFKLMRSLAQRLQWTLVNMTLDSGSGHRSRWWQQRSPGQKLKREYHWVHTAYLDQTCQQGTSVQLPKSQYWSLAGEIFP